MLIRDQRWEIFYGDISLEEFAAEMPRAVFKSEVNQQVKDSFEIVHKLLTHSYYEYLFLDIAVTRALQIFEMALVLRYYELNGVEWDPKKRLIQLMDWFKARDYFEINDKGFLDHVRNSRNALSHLKGHHFAGTASIHWIDTICDLINGLYEDVKLRKVRWSSTNEFQEKLNSFLSKGGKFQCLDQLFYIYSLGPLKVDNRLNTTVCYFSLLPIFDPSSTIPKIPIVLMYPHNQLDLDTSVVDFTFGSNKVFLSNQLNVAEQQLIRDFNAKISSIDEYRFHDNAMVFVASNEIQKLIRQANRPKNTVSLE